MSEKISMELNTSFRTKASLSKVEQEVLAHPKALSEYSSFMRQGKMAEAQAVLNYYVYVHEVHDSHSKSKLQEISTLNELSEVPEKDDYNDSYEDKSQENDNLNIKPAKRSNFQRHEGSVGWWSRLVYYIVRIQDQSAFCFMYVACVGFDVAADVILANSIRSDSDFTYKTWTLIIISLPYIFTTLRMIWIIILERIVRKEKYSQHTVRDVLSRYPILLPIRNIRHFIGIVTMDLNNQQNFKIVRKIYQDAIDTTFVLVFLSSAPQLINQLAYILETKSLDWFILCKLISSGVTTVTASTTIFFNHRVSRAKEAVINLKGFVIVAFFTFALNAVSVLLLAVISLESRLYSLVVIVSTFFTNLLVGILVLKKCRVNKDLPIETPLSVHSPGGLAYLDLKTRALDQAKVLLLKSMAVAWVAPCTVWSNNVFKKYLLLPVSCLVSMIWLLGGFVVVTSNFQLPAENSTDGLDAGFRDIIAVNKLTLALIAIGIYVVAGMSLFYLGNPLEFFKVSKNIPGPPVVQLGLIYDYFWSYDLLPKDKIETIKEAISFAYKDSPNVFIQPDDFDTSPMHIAAYNKLLHDIDRMTYSKGDLEAKDQCRKSVAEIVLELSKLENFPDKEMAKKLVQKFDESKPTPPTIFTYQHDAVVDLDFSTYNLLLSIGVQPSGLDQRGLSPLEGLIKKLQEKKDLKGIERFKDVTDENGYTLLHLALGLAISEKAKISANVLKTLAHDIGVDPNRKSFNGTTPLHMAVLSKSVEFVKCLIECEAKVMVYDHRGNTPLHYAAGDGQKEILEELVSRSNVNSKNVFGSTPISIAALWGHPSCVEILLKNGADAGITDCLGNNAAHNAAWGTHTMGIFEKKSTCFSLITEYFPSTLNMANLKNQSPEDILSDESKGKLHTPPNH